MTESAAVKTPSPAMKLMKSKQAPKAEAQAPEAVAPVETKLKPAIAKAVAPKAVEKVEADASTSVDLIVQTVHEIENLKEDKAFAMVPKLLDNIDHDYFRLGGVLAHIQSEGWFMDKGHENFRAYIETECGMAYRKSMYLIQIYNALVASGVSWEKVKSIGWTKLKEIAPIITPDTVDEWVALAGDNTVLQLQDLIKVKTAGSGKETSAESAIPDSAKKTTTMTFKLHEDQKATIREALDKCKHETGTDVDTVALEHICLDFLGKVSTSPAVAAAPAPSLQEMMAGMGVEDILTALGEVYPDLQMEVTMPE